MAEETEGAEGNSNEGDSSANPDGTSQSQSEATTESSQSTQSAGSNQSAGSASTGEPSWRDSIDDGGARKMSERFTSPAAMAKAYSELNTEFSKRIRVPGEDASDEDVAHFRKLTGVPEKAGDYKFDRPEGIGKEIYDSGPYKEVLGEFTAIAHKHGASNDLAQELLNWRADAGVKALAARAEMDKRVMGDTDTALRKEWGQEYDANFANAEDAAANFGFESVLQVELADGSLLGSNPTFVKLMSEVGMQTGRGTAQLGTHGTEAGKDTQAEYDRLSSEIHTAFDRGDKDLATRLENQRRPLSVKLHGTANI